MRSSWITDDITFCIRRCSWKRCVRNKVNIHHPELPHSFADLKDTEDCLRVQHRPVEVE